MLEAIFLRFVRMLFVLLIVNEELHKPTDCLAYMRAR